MSYNNFHNPGGFATANQYAPPNGNNYAASSYGEGNDSLDFDLNCINPNAEPWEIAQQLSGGDRDIGSNYDMHRAFTQAQNMNVKIDEVSSRSMYEQANTTSRGGGTSLTTKLVAGAAGWAAMSYYQKHQKQQGKQVNHAFLKKMVAAIAMAQAVKMFNKHRSNGSFMGLGGHRDVDSAREAVAAEAAANAMQLVDQQAPADAKFQYNGAPPTGYGQQGGYNAPPPQFNSYNNQPNYGAPNYAQGNYMNAPPAVGYGAPPANFSGPPMGSFPGAPQPGYGAPPVNPSGPLMGGFPGGPQQGYNAPPAYGGNAGPGGFINPNQRKY
ncbi:hypothetical protein DSO57_1013432 [Entomophthora muscae]|uniref:Uncharacterized protein n=1 Tax=Entomophthora muscae TaxID=34485 RepID=A0ACC2TTU5_9FUNG|nr:hypothetical protein DSO57_1013432 [Entomophthora muscae]